MTGFNYDATWAEQASAPAQPGTGKQKIYPKADGFWYTQDDAGVETLLGGGGTAPAPNNATYIVQTASSGLSAEQALSSLATGLMKVTTSTGVVSSITDSAGLAGVISDETGTGALVFADSPALTGNVGVTGDGNSTPILTLTNTDSSGAPGNTLRLRSSRSSTALQTNDRVGTLVVEGYGATGYGGVIGNFGFFAAENFTDGAQGTYFLLGLTPNGAAGSNEIYRVFGAGNFLLGNSSTVTAPLNFLGLGGNAARSMGMERHLTSNTAGNNLTVQSGGATSGATDKPAGTLILATGVNTGSAVPAPIRLQSGAISAASGTSDNAVIDRELVGMHKVLTNNVATALMNLTVAALTGVGGIIRYHVEVTDGTDIQSESGLVRFNAVNKAGTVTTTIGKSLNQSAVSSGATLTTTWTLSAANPAVLSVNANSSLTPSSGYPRITYTVDYLGQQAIAAA